MIILGIDPGTTRIGFALLEKKRGVHLVECGLLRVASKAPRERMKEAVSHFRDIVAHHEPALLSIEKLFFAKNRRTAIAVSELRGALLLAAEEAGIHVVEYAPTEVKRMVAGDGRAEKGAVAKMALLSLHKSSVPGPDDVTDAIAIALAAAYDITATYKE